MENKNSGGCKLSLILSLISIVLASAAYFCPKKAAQPEQASTFDERVKGTLIDVIKNDPQIITDAISEGLAKKRDEELKNLSQGVMDKRADITKQSIKFGNTNSKNVFYCFFDPLCKHCIDFQKSMLKLIKAKKDVVFHMLPVAVLGDDSINLAKYYFAVAERSTEKALGFIESIVTSENMDKKAIEKALKSVDLSEKDIEASLEESDKKLGSNGQLATNLRLPIVPAIFFSKGGSNAMMVQATSVEQLLAILEAPMVDAPVIPNSTSKVEVPETQADATSEEKASTSDFTETEPSKD